MSISLISDLARRIADLVEEPDIVRRADMGRELRLWIAREVSPLDVAITCAPDLTKAERRFEPHWPRRSE